MFQILKTLFAKAIYAARRYASAALAIVGMSVRLSVTLVDYVKTAEPIIMQSIPRGSPANLVSPL